ECSFVLGPSSSRAHTVQCNDRHPGRTTRTTAMKPTDIRIADVSYDYEDYRYRTPIKFGGVAVDRATILNVRVTAETRSRRTPEVFGPMPLSTTWAFQTKKRGYEDRLGAMKELVAASWETVEECPEFGHPVELGHALEPQFLAHLGPVGAELGLAEPIPVLAALVAASPFDAAIHDAFGKVHGLNCYQTYGPAFLSTDLGHYLGKEFAGETLDRYVLAQPQPRMPIDRLGGALGPLTKADVKPAVGDGRPETLGEWIKRDGLTHLKVKLNGDNLEWDVERVVAVNMVATEAQRQRGVSQWWYSLDFNERCESVVYLLAFLHELRERAPAAYERVQYIEQPTARDLKANPANRMHEAAKFKPVV